MFGIFRISKLWCMRAFKCPVRVTDRFYWSLKSSQHFSPWQLWAFWWGFIAHLNMKIRCLEFSEFQNCDVWGPSNALCGSQIGFTKGLLDTPKTLISSWFQSWKPMFSYRSIWYRLDHFGISTWKKHWRTYTHAQKHMRTHMHIYTIRTYTQYALTQHTHAHTQTSTHTRTHTHIHTRMYEHITSSAGCLCFWRHLTI